MSAGKGLGMFSPRTKMELLSSVKFVVIALLLVSCAPAKGQATEAGPPTQQNGYVLVDERCSEENCLFVRESEQEYPVGVATVTGYYTRLERSAFGQTRQCDSLVITDGPSVLVQSLLTLIEQKNTVYTKNEAGQPVVSLDLQPLAGAEKRRIISSSRSEPVSMLLLATSPTYQGVPVCFSHFQILRVLE